jgi:hypothetical protein
MMKLPVLTLMVVLGASAASGDTVTVQGPRDLKSALSGLKTNEPGFVPCRNVVIKDNRIVFRRSQVKVDLNIGKGTEAGTFQFENNRWFAEDKPVASRPKLPVEEANGVYGVDPR